jgi:uncharacterized protein YndB with AHSA1/START domain
MTSELGALRKLDDDTNRLVFVRTLAHPIDKVWRAVTEPGHQQHWFPDGPFDGEVLVSEPPHRLELQWFTDRIRIELAVTPDGRGTVLTFTDTFAELGKAARDGAGWHDCLDELGHHLDGTAADLPMGTRWKALNAAYVDELGPEAATIGVPEGYELPD